VRIAFSTIACPSYGPEQMAEAARAYGYDGVELYAAWGRTLTPDLLAPEITRVRRALRGVAIVCLNSFATLGALDERERTASEASLDLAIELAAALECPLVKAFGGDVPDGVSRERVALAAAALLARADARAEPLGVACVVETHDGFCRGRDLAALLALAPAATGALWDVHHPVRMGETADETDDAIGARVAHVHVKDAIASGDRWRFTALGEGALPVPELLTKLARRSFDGVVSVDYEKLWYAELDEPERSLPQHAAVLRKEIAAAEARAVLPTP
jgi:sugar phosphate isomerase/epimerase